jgi:plastocyanin
MKLRTFTIGAAALTFALAACGDPSSSGGGGAGAAPAPTVAAGRSGDYGTPAAPASTTASTTPAAPATGGGVTIKDFTFNVPASVKAGTAFTIKNEDGFKHTFTEKGGLFDVAMPAGATESLTVQAPGTYEIICQIHARMHATLVVT